MPIILEISQFLVAGHDKPHHCRSNGGHIRISPVEKYENVFDMPLELANAWIHLIMVVGQAAITVLKRKGFDVVRINFQDNGNWSYKEHMKREPHVHEHLYIRTRNEKHPTGDSRFQAFPDALFFPDPRDPYYESFQPLTEEDCTEIRKEIERLLQTEDYRNSAFTL